MAQDGNIRGQKKTIQAHLVFGLSYIVFIYIPLAKESQKTKPSVSGAGANHPLQEVTEIGCISHGEGLRYANLLQGGCEDLVTIVELKLHHTLDTY